MIEPTETESKAVIDAFIAVMIEGGPGAERLLWLVRCICQQAVIYDMKAL